MQAKLLEILEKIEQVAERAKAKAQAMEESPEVIACWLDIRWIALEARDAIRKAKEAKLDPANVEVATDGGETTGLLASGDMIELRKGHSFYAELPEHCIYQNRVGVFGKLSKTEVTIGEPKNGLATDFYAGRYVVIKTSEDGGGSDSMGGSGYPDGHHVFCRHASLPIEVDFYQTGCFTAMIRSIDPVGKANLRWEIRDAQPATSGGG